MAEYENFTILKEYAEKYRRTISTSEHKYPDAKINILPHMSGLQRHKRSVIINEQKKDWKLLFYSDPFTKVGEMTIYCGAFVPIRFPESIKFRVIKSNILVSLFGRKGRLFTFADSFMKKAAVYGEKENINEIERFLHLQQVKDAIVEALTVDDRIYISVNKHKIDFDPDFEDVSCLSLSIEKEWILDENTLEKLVVAIEKISKSLSAY